MSPTYKLSEIQLRFAVPQHVLIHLCEKDVISPDVSDTSGRGRWREFSERNLFEFALALELRKYELPVSRVRAIIKILGAFERATQKATKEFNIGESLKTRPKVKLYLFDGTQLVFSIGSKSLLTFELQKLLDNSNARVQPNKLSKLPTAFHSHLEVDLSDLAKSIS